MGTVYIVSLLGQCWWLFRERITRWPRRGNALRHARPMHDCASTMWLWLLPLALPRSAPTKCVRPWLQWNGSRVPDPAAGHHRHAYGKHKHRPHCDSFSFTRGRQPTPFSILANGNAQVSGGSVKGIVASVILAIFFAFFFVLKKEQLYEMNF